MSNVDGWYWWAGSYAEVEYEGTYTLGEFDSREEAIADEALRTELGRDIGADAPPLFYLIEAQTGDAEHGEHDLDDPVPFAAVRNKQLMVNHGDHAEQA